MSNSSKGVRSRWAAIGAAVAVTLGAGGVGWVAASGTPSAFVSITPERILDTRVGLGLEGPFTSPAARSLQVTGAVPTPGGSSTVVPDGATGVVLNVTAVQPTADGFVSVRPDGTPGAPTTSSLNFSAGDIIPNAVTVALPPSGAIDITYDAFGAVGPTTDLLVDVTGYYTAGGVGAPGPAGPTGPTGATGATGATGPAGPGTLLFADTRSNNVSWTSSATVALQGLTAEFPSAGYAVVTGTVQIANQSETIRLGARVSATFDGPTTFETPTFAVGRAARNLVVNATDIPWIETTSFVAVVPVEAGTYDVEHVLDTQTGSVDIIYSARTLTVQFFPAGQTTVTP